MRNEQTSVLLAGLGAVLLFVPMVGCEEKAEPARPAPTGGAAKPAASDPAPAKADDGHDHGHGPATALGEQTAGGLTVKATREGELKPGGDAAFDISVGGPTKPVAVRIWVGTQDGKGSVKSKADAEKDGWHAHAEVPDPLPTGSKLWVEVELEKAEKLLVGFELKL